MGLADRRQRIYGLVATTRASADVIPL